MQPAIKEHHDYWTGTTPNGRSFSIKTASYLTGKTINGRSFTIQTYPKMANGRNFNITPINGGIQKKAGTS